MNKVCMRAVKHSVPETRNFARFLMRNINVVAILELELLICGLPDIDINDLKANTEYKGVQVTAKVIEWFWQIVEEMSQEVARTSSSSLYFLSICSPLSI